MNGYHIGNIALEVRVTQVWSYNVQQNINHIIPLLVKVAT